MASLLKVSRLILSNPSATRCLMSAKSRQMVPIVQNVFSRMNVSTTTNSDLRTLAQVQKPAPEFKGMAVIDGQFKEICLKDYIGKWVCLFFYPLDFTFVCPTEIIAFNDRADEFKALNADLIAVSVDSHYSHLAWINTPRNKGGLGLETKIPILSDLKKQIARDYCCLTESNDISLRASYIIDTKGIIRHITVNDLPVGRSVDETLRIIKAFQFVEQNGEVCPANWQPKEKTINPKKAGEYFSSVFNK